MSILKTIRDIKNNSVSVLAKGFINKNIQKYGEVLDFKIDSKNKNIELELFLKGERENILIKINKYEIVDKSGSNFIKFKSVSASREWIEALLKNVVLPNYAAMNMVEIGSKYAKIIELLI